jgi:hypothetical protein
MVGLEKLSVGWVASRPDTVIWGLELGVGVSEKLSVRAEVAGGDSVLKRLDVLGVGGGTTVEITVVGGGGGGGL